MYKVDQKRFRDDFALGQVPSNLETKWLSILVLCNNLGPLEE